MTRLQVDNLSVRFAGAERAAVDDLSFAIEAGESVALTGLSGSGKTQTGLAILGLSPPAATVSGRIRYGDVDIVGASPKALRGLRARRLAMVFQDPAAALNPHRRVGAQLTRILETHGLASGKDSRERMLAMLERVGLPDPRRQARAYPHELSGGMRQRVMIASALIAEPELVIADEPTTALDSTVQAQILRLLDRLIADAGCSLLLITHDFGVIARAADRLLVLDHGKLVDDGPCDSLLVEPQHAATRRLLEATTAPLQRSTPGDQVTLAADDVEVRYVQRMPGRVLRRCVATAVQPTSLAVRRGETLALVGESGSGKTSLARAICGLVKASGGRFSLLGDSLPAALSVRPNDTLAQLQMVFQDPPQSLDPAMRVRDVIAEPLTSLLGPVTTDERDSRIRSIVARVGLEEALLARRPTALSGGQAQRVALARALIVEPALLVADEAVSALDAPVRHQILECLAAEQRDRGLAVLFISHDLGVVLKLSHRVAVMYAGEIVELGDTDRLFADPQHEHTRALIAAALSPDPAQRLRRPQAGLRG